MNYPVISIITPSFNQGHFIEQTICSVLDQKYPNLEYIIIDGGSTDNSVEIIKKYEKFIHYWVSEKDRGQSDAINKGLKLATGSIINWLNSDDYYEQNTLSIVNSAFQDPEVSVVCGKSRLFCQEGMKDKTLYYSQGTDVYRENLAKTLGWARIDQPETFFRKSVVDKMGLLDTRLHYLMDRDWWLKYLFLFGLKEIKKIPDVLVNFRLHANSKTVSKLPMFQVEHDTFYYSLAKTHGLSGYANLISSLFQVNEDFEIQQLKCNSKELVSQVVNYFLLKRADEKYAQNDVKTALYLLKNINNDQLAKEDLKLKSRLYFRCKYVPQFIIRTLRRNRF